MRHAITTTQATKLHRERLPGRVADGGNLYLVDGLSWQVRFTWRGKPQTITVGRYPITSIAQARAARDEVLAKVAAGTDPRAKAATDGTTFSDVATRWLATQTTVTDASIVRHQRAIDRAARALGSMPIGEVTVRHVRPILDALHSSGLHGELEKTRGTLSQVFRYAGLHELVAADPVALLKGAYALKAVEHYPHLEGAKAIRELMCRLRAYKSTAGGGEALMLQLLAMVRPGEACGARWSEIDLDGNEPTWRIPAARMKKREPHHVPLSTQAVALLRAQLEITGPEGPVFQGQRNKAKPITTAAVEGALRSMGYESDQLVPHGLRGTASTYLNGVSANDADIELCLAHADTNKVRAAYNHAKRIPERRALLQQWADALDAMAAKPQ